MDVSGLAATCRNLRERILSAHARIIGGSGLTQLANLDVFASSGGAEPPMGRLPGRSLSARSAACRWCSSRATARSYHSTHQVNYRANFGRSGAGAGEIVAVVSVGGIRAGPRSGKDRRPAPDHRPTWAGRARFSEKRDAGEGTSTSTEPYAGECETSFSPRQKGCGEAASTARSMLRPRARTGDGRGNRRSGNAKAPNRRHDGNARGGPGARVELAYAAIAVVVNHAAAAVQAYAACRLQRSEHVLKDAVGRVRKIIEALAERAIA